MTTANIDWNAIRPLNGSRAEGFEELCAQLADAEAPPNARFERKGTPDAGVECYAVLDDGSEWGWQAKYLDTLADSQWSQLDESVKAALSKHPRLVRYYICVPLNRSDARVDGRRSAKDRWDDHVKKWTGWASGRDTPVEFVYWGSYELLQRLTKPEHIGRVRFWFNIQGFDRTWFNDRLDEALRSAGPRYTPELHVELPISAEIAAFGRTDQFFNKMKSQAIEIRKSLSTFRHREGGTSTTSIDDLRTRLVAETNDTLQALSALTVKPVGSLPFKDIAALLFDASATCEMLDDALSECEREYDAKAATTSDQARRSGSERNPFRDMRYRLGPMLSTLAKAQRALAHADVVAGSDLMLLKGTAGTGKTHLLCDVARQRLADGRPTVLLMGQRFLASAEPWTQALQQLDLAGLSVEEFVGSLEAAAQAARCRALVMIDALNEGAGRQIWPAHLPAFLAALRRSEWIAVLLSVRSSYDKIVVPEEVRTKAVEVTHHGFADREYDATRTFFVHYGLELPSTPLLAPEFSNPLFLKSLCSGLHAKGERRLPRGFQGISYVLDLYLSAVNDRLAASLDFNPKAGLPRQALEIFASALAGAGQRWLSLSKAAEVVDALLPDRGFERSLYRGLVVEGVLIEEAGWPSGAEREEVVFVAYDRFADHLIARTLLDQHLDQESPESAFAPDAPLGFICDANEYVAPGLLEALSIQVPERIQKELVALAPKLVERWETGAAFRQSLVWRSPQAFSEGTWEALRTLNRSEYDLRETLDALITVAAIPGHPLNADFLDKRLRSDAMPDRDAWWSTYLHLTWGTQGAVDRLVDWAWLIRPDNLLDDEAIDLCATALAWMFTTANRSLRDRATKALVTLMTGRTKSATRLVKRFADVDDPYVTERVYAVAYGTAMRCRDPHEIGELAACVYDQVFAHGRPPAQILLRDYARGTIERALYLGAAVGVDVGLFRPPYRSDWPPIPTEEAIKPFLPDWSRGSHDSGDAEWARNRIGNSVMSDDFARYVIGTNSSSTDWLSLRLEESSWRSPKQRLATLLPALSEDEHSAWTRVEAADAAIAALSMEQILTTIRFVSTDESDHPETANTDAASDRKMEGSDQDVAALAAAFEEHMAALAALRATLSEENAGEMEAVLSAKDNGPVRNQPLFDLAIIQRYVLWRVFDLGWTTERFGQFDRFSIWHQGRGASKAERIGKKYQWIAYHEILALVADHFQYRERFREEHGEQAYEGTWQGHLRDIDPSCTLRAVSGGTSWSGHSPAWWGVSRFDNWGESADGERWTVRSDDLPRIEELLRVSHPDDESHWLNVQGYFSWDRPPPPDQERTDVERRGIWYIITGYLVRCEDADAFMAWAESVDFWGRWMPEPPEIYRMFLGEHGWSPASRHFNQPYYGASGWTQPDHDCPVQVCTIALEYLCEGKGFDCSIDEGFTLRLPAAELLNDMGLRWIGDAADFVDASGKLTATDPTVYAAGPNALLFREDTMMEYLKREGLTICWSILGEKQVLGPGFGPSYYTSLQISGAYRLRKTSLDGFLKCTMDSRGSGGQRPVSIIRNEPAGSR